MPSTYTATNIGASAWGAGDLVELVEELEPGQGTGRTATIGGRPIGVSQRTVTAGAVGTLHVNGVRSAWLGPGESVAVGDRLAPGADGAVRKAPAGYAGWLVGLAAETRAAGASRTGLALILAPRLI